MKAWVLHNLGDIRYETVKAPMIAENEALVAVKAAGVCGSDIPRIYRTGAYSYPLVVGHEFSGVVAETGSAVDASWQGQRVGIFPLIPCKTCAPCKKRQYEMCRHYGYLGSRRDGGFAECAAVPADNLIKLPEGVSFAEAAMLEPMAVAVHAMRKTAPAATDTVAVCGLGTIGLLLLMFLLETGEWDARDSGKILVIGNKEFQKQTVLKMGLPKSCYCDGSSQDVDSWLDERTNGGGVDVFFECVGKNETVAQAVNHTAPAGRICLVGNPSSDMKLKKDIYWKILRNQLTVTGTWNSSFTHDSRDDWHYVLDRISDQRIAPKELISHHFRMEELERGFHIMRDKTEDYIKVMGVLE